ncbi:FAD/NAD(P)-binding protein [Streptomyces sp. BPTC-684]|uniref:FAD/NAD(P)-binding protein n=1 Tax=Streptomyces sp. BPTC-684 TaxID=3043734 RepID=UPI0024B11497|nr:FAD/NAD(P)-binding protein [Streptomyces sp. BPTC-684]WHM37865.1 FAD/NAD(P)-binding protein [Streptomyces sp. BPTC-684]
MNGRLSVGIVGMGPRGLTVLERLCANAAVDPGARPVTVHAIDPAPAGAGRVWRTDQSAHLLMNTVAEQITVFTDASVSCAGPVVPGPNLYEWATLLAVVGEAEGYPDDVVAQARALGPNSYPTRALYGRYLRWAFRRTVETAPRHVTVRVHRDTAVELGEQGARQVLRLAGGDRLLLDAVVLAQGHVPAVPAPGPAARHIRPGNPADVDLDAIAPGEPVALRGLGLTFFDYLALLTQGRGGVFEERADGRLDYRASGREPRLYAGSRRGVPYRARGDNQKGLGERHEPVLLTARTIAALRERAASHGDVRFRRDVWPLIAREVEIVYYRTLLRQRGESGEAVEEFLRCCLLGRAGSPLDEKLLRRHGIEERDRWSWETVETPYGGQALRGPREFTHWLVEHLERDVARARGGNVGDPVKSALDALRDLRNEIRQVVDHAGLTGDSYRDELTGWYSPFNAALSIGPPRCRIAEMAALIRAGVLEPVGPGMRATPGASSGFLISSVVPGPPVHVTTLIEARIQDPDVRATADPLLRGLLDTGRATPYRLPNPDGVPYETGALAVTERPSRLLDAYGRAHPRRFALGIPTEGVHWATAAGVRPGVDSVSLGDADAVARELLGCGAVRSAGRVEVNAS